ncbi:MAG: tRNA epoxyqueuosine(34) reductase QueG [Planctomycetota bacterium]|jgi:epoxyqueuosine reductase
MNLAEAIKHEVHRLGFDLAGITDASPIAPDQVKFFTNWLKAGCAARMDYMHRNFKKRINPAELLDDALSVIVVGLNYKPPETPKPAPAKTDPVGRIAHYAQYQDYHLFIKNQLRKLIDFITSIAGPGFKFKICIDSAPVAERPLAARAGLGFIGKNHMLINPALGPQLFLGEIIINLKLQPDKPVTADCSACNKCIKACPTGALRPDGQFDANKCISYLTIEYKQRIPSDLAAKIGDRLFGCDECVLACPYQQNAPVCKNKRFRFYKDRARLSLKDILNLEQQDFDSEFADSVIDRLGLDALKRNAQICLVNVNA